MEIGSEQKKKVVRGYLGPFIAKPSSKVIGRLVNYSCDQNILIKCNTSEINQIITYLLIKSGRKNYKVFSASEIIDIYVGNNPEYSNYADIDIRNIFILVQKFEMDNVRKWDLPVQLAMYRKNKGFPTVMITDEDRPPYFERIKEMGFKFIIINKNKLEDKDEDF